MSTLWKSLLLLAFGPVIVLVSVQVVAGLVVAILPVLFVVGIAAGAVAGLVAGLSFRRRLRQPPAAPLLPRGDPPLGVYRRRRPAGRWR